MNRRELELGDSNDQFIVVTGGLEAGDEVVLNPRAHIDEAQAAALKPLGETPIASPGDSAGTDPTPATDASPTDAAHSDKSDETAVPAAADNKDSGGAQP